MTAFEYAPQERLLRALAEQLKMPLLQIARQAELRHLQQPDGTLQSIQQTSDMAIRLIDGYLLSTEAQTQAALTLEPVSVSSLLQDIAHQLTPLARQYDHEIVLSINGKYAPVMADQKSLETALTMLGYAMIESQPADSRHVVTLGAHKSAHGIVAGVFGEQEGLSTEMFRRARALYGRSRQPLAAMSTTAGASVFVADTLLSAMSAPLRVAHHHKMAGFAATLLPSQQLQLV